MWVWEMFVEMLKGDWISKTLGAIFAITCLLLLSMVLWILWELVLWADGFRQPVERAPSCLVRGRSYRRAFFYTMLMPVGNGILIPSLHRIPESWLVNVQFAGRTYWVRTTQKTFDSLDSGQEVHFYYKEGRFSRRIYPVSVG